MKFDSNLAWKQASAAITANRELLLALSGVFFLLPSLVIGLLFPQPEPPAGMNETQMMKMLSDYYVSALPLMLPMTLVQAAGTLALLTLVTDRSRPTVREAIRIGLAGILPYIGAQLLLGLGLGVVGGLLLAVTAATGVAVLIAAAVAAVISAVIYLAIRTSLSAPAIAVEGERNPVRALRRSWALTQGNAARIGVFYALVAIAFLIVSLVVMGVFGAVLALVASGRTVDVVMTVVSSGLGALMTLYFAAIMAAVHHQLAGPSPAPASAPLR